MTDGLGAFEYIQLAIFYASYLYFPAAICLIFWTVKHRGLSAIIAMLIFLALTVLAYARFVEPRILVTNEFSLTFKRCFPENGAMRIAVFSDTHNGLYANAMPIERIVARVNDARPDVVMIAGDFTYFLHPDRIEETFAGLGKIKTPVLGVLGNHDFGLPAGPDLTGELDEELSRIGVEMIDDRKIFLNRNGARVEVIGISDLWRERQRMSLVTKKAPYPRIMLTHNPETVNHIPERAPVDLLVSGHTHGGQINIPFITCKIVAFACRIKRYGLRAKNRGVVFVTAGTGMVGLPMRFNMPPRIDVVNIRYNACDDAAPDTRN